MAKKIAIDLSYIKPNYNTGVAKYAYRFLEYIRNCKRQKDYLLIVMYSSYGYFSSSYSDFEIKSTCAKWMEKFGPLRRIIYAFGFRYTMNSVDTNVLFCPWGNPINSFKTKQKKIVTIHDLQMRIDRKSKKKRDVLLYIWTEDKLAKNAEAIFTISEFSKNQILTYYPKVKNKLYNMYNSVSMNIPAGIEPMSPGYKYLLYVGRMDEMKNVITLIRAFDIIKDGLPDYKVVLLSNSWSYYESIIRPEVESRHLQDKLILVKNCGEDELTQWYMGASLFVFPSLREGFGSPPIEASILLVPVLTSKADSLEEVTLGLLNYYEPPTDEHELAQSIVKCIENPLSKEKLQEIRNLFMDNYSISVVGQRISEHLDAINN